MKNLPVVKDSEHTIGIWAHRGCSYAYPENTLPAFKAACQLPVTGIELDIHLSKDGEVVVIHDETVDRTTNGKGTVAEMTLAELQRLDIPYHPKIQIGKKTFLYKHARIPTIRQVFDLVRPYCRKNGLKINIELKTNRTRYEGIEEKILEIVKEYGLEDSIVYSSFNPDSIIHIKQLDPTVKTGILNASEAACLEFARSHDVDALHPARAHLDVEDIRGKTALPVRVWSNPTETLYPVQGEITLQDFDELASLGVTDIFTNVPECYVGKRVHRMSFIPGTSVDEETGLFRRNDSSCLADFHVLEVNSGDRLDFSAEGYEYKLAMYGEAVEDRLMHTFCYQEDGNWASYSGNLKEDSGWKSGPHEFQEHGWIRVIARRKDGGETSQSDADALASACSLLRTYRPYEPKAYFEDEIRKTVSSVKALQDADTLTFGLLTDNHYVINGGWEDTAYNLSRVSEGAGFDGLIHLGDFTDGITPAAITTEWAGKVLGDMRSLGVPLYPVLGNHDCNYCKGNPELLDLGTQSSLYLGRERPYYHVDIGSHKLRMLVLWSFDVTQENRYGFPDAEVDWVRDTLAGTPPGYKVLVLSHVPLLPEMHYWNKNIRNSGSMLATLEQYVRDGGRLLGYVHGHNHADQINREHSFPIVSVGCAKCEDFKDKKPEGSVTYDRAMHTLTQELWDVMLVNTRTETLSFVRFGAGEDRTVKA